MDLLSSDDIMRLLEPIWVKAQREERYHEAALLGFLAYVSLRESEAAEAEDDAAPRPGVYVASDWIRRSMAAIGERCGCLPAEPPATSEDLEPACSFCGSRPPRVRLAAGPSVFICEACVATLGDVFAADTAT